MQTITALLLLVLGLLAASSVLGNVSDDLERFVDEVLRPVQGWLGLIGCALGIVFLLQVLFGATWALRSAGMGVVIVGYGGPALLATTGFLMGFSKIVELIGGRENVAEQAQRIYAALQPYQVALGIACLVVGILSLLL